MREFLLAFKEASKPFRRMALERCCHGCQTNHPSLFQHECKKVPPFFFFLVTQELITLTPQEDVLRALQHLIESKNENDTHQHEKITPSNVISLWRERPFEELRQNQGMQRLLEAYLFPPLEEESLVNDEREHRSRYCSPLPELKTELCAATAEEREHITQLEDLTQQISELVFERDCLTFRIEMLQEREDELRELQDSDRGEMVKKNTIQRS